MYKIIALMIFIASGSIAAGEAPDFDLQSSRFNKLSDLENQVVYLDFWASWCNPCRSSFPWMNDLQQKYANQGFVVIAVNVDREKGLADEFLKQVPADFHIVFDADGKIAKDYQVLGMPSSYLIDRQGQVRFVHRGFYEKKIADYESEISALLKEQPEG